MKLYLALAFAVFGFFTGIPLLHAVDVGLFNISDAVHPQPFHDAVGEVSIRSMANDNRSYFLAIRATTTFSLPCEKLALIVRNKTIRFESQGMGDNGTFTSMEATITDPDVIPDIAKYFHVTVLQRQHPGYQLLTEFIPTKAEFTNGEPVLVKLRITNLGNRDIRFLTGGGDRMAIRDNTFAFTAQAGQQIMPDVGSAKNYGGMMGNELVNPAHSYEKLVDLNKWFDFKEGGDYQIRGSYHMSFVNPNTTTNLDIIWEDYPCAEFSVEIKTGSGQTDPGILRHTP